VWLDAITKRNCVGCIYSENFAAELQRLTDWSKAFNNARILSIPLAKIPIITTLSDTIISRLAERLLLLWPDWYEGKVGPCESVGQIPKFVQAAVDQCPDIQSAWLRTACNCCVKQRPPTSKKIAAAIQARQLGLALGGSTRIVSILVNESNPSDVSLIGLSRSAEWISREASVSVLLMMNPSLKNRVELDAVNYFGGFELDAIHPVLNAPPELDDGVVKRWRSEELHAVSPILGRPHPSSPGENRLANQLASDPELKSLFQFNVAVISRFDNRYIVDLLWEAGRVVVEVDGYGYHSNVAQFNADRERDYELLVSDYVVLRLPHDFVVADPALACERIRDVVRFRSTN